MSLEKTYDSYRESDRKRRAWAADNPGNRAIRAELLAHVLDLAHSKLEGKGKVLDIGCGGGWLLEQLNRQDVDQPRLHGVDLLEPRVSAARRRLPDADIRQADARCLPFPDDEFGLVAMLTSLSSMGDRDSVRQALLEAHRVMAPGGMLLCYEPCVPNSFNRATTTVSPRLLQAVLGPATEIRRLTGLPPLARRLGVFTPHIYPLLARLGPTHAITCWGH